MRPTSPCSILDSQQHAFKQARIGYGLQIQKENPTSGQVQAVDKEYWESYLRQWLVFVDLAG